MDAATGRVDRTRFPDFVVERGRRGCIYRGSLDDSRVVRRPGPEDLIDPTVAASNPFAAAARTPASGGTRRPRAPFDATRRGAGAAGDAICFVEPTGGRRRPSGSRAASRRPPDPQARDGGLHNTGHDSSPQQRLRWGTPGNWCWFLAAGHCPSRVKSDTPAGSHGFSCHRSPRTHHAPAESEPSGNRTRRTEHPPHAPLDSPAGGVRGSPGTKPRTPGRVRWRCRRFARGSSARLRCRRDPATPTRRLRRCRSPTPGHSRPGHH